MKAGTERDDRKEPEITTATADVREVAIDDMDDSRSSDPSSDEEDKEIGGDSSDTETDDGDGNGNGTEGELMDDNVSRTIPCSSCYDLS